MKMTRYSNHASRSSRMDNHDNHTYQDDGDEDEYYDDDDEIDELSDSDDDEELADRQSNSRDTGRFADRIGSHGDVFRRQRSFSDCTSHNLELDDNRRDHHNQLERKRRASIKTSYNDLREAIPSLRGSKASRAVILQRAVECIQELVRRNRDHTHCVETLRRQNDILDARVQELQRFAQRLDDEVSNISTIPFSSGSTSSSSLRLCPTSAHSGPGTSGLPVYRLLPSDSVTKSSSIHIIPGSSNTLRPSTSLPRSTVTTVSRTRVVTLPTVKAQSSFTSNLSEFTGINALSAAACLLSSGHSAFSSGSPSSCSNCEPTQSLSQRSSPGCISSVSNTSSSNQGGTSSRTDPCEDSTLQFDTSCTIDSTRTPVCTTVTVTSGSCATANSNVGSGSPPPILLSVPVRPVPTCTVVTCVAAPITSQPPIIQFKKRRVI